MKDLLDKLSSYNIFNYLLPGVLLAVFIDQATQLKLLSMNPVASAFVWYFLGSVLSRIGSLVVEPAMKRLRLVAFAPYGDFVRAEKRDPKLEILSETNNMYRTFCGLLLFVALFAGYQLAAEHWALLYRVAPAIAVASLFVLFAASYRKQTGYIRERIAADLQEEDGGGS